MRLRNDKKNAAAETTPTTEGLRRDFLTDRHEVPVPVPVRFRFRFEFRFGSVPVRFETRVVPRDAFTRAAAAAGAVWASAALHQARLSGDVRAGRAVFPARAPRVRGPAGPGYLGDGARESRAGALRVSLRVFGSGRSRGVPRRAVPIATRGFERTRSGRLPRVVGASTRSRAGTDTGNRRRLAPGGLTRVRAGGGVRALLARDLRSAGGSPDLPSRSAETRAGSAGSLRAGAADATMTDAFAPTSQKRDERRRRRARGRPARRSCRRRARALAARRQRCWRRWRRAEGVRRHSVRARGRRPVGRRAGTTTPFGPPPNERISKRAAAASAGRRRWKLRRNRERQNCETANANATPCLGPRSRVRAVR